MAINDPRLELARRAAQGMQAPNIRSLNQVLQPGSAVVPKLPPSDSAAQAYQDMVAKAAAQFTDVKRRNEAIRIAQGKQHNANPGGIQGFLSDALDNPIVKAITEPLKVLDIPRRAVISGIHEISDAIGSGDASWSDFTNQVNDPSFGVGKFVHTGNKWVDRAIGLVGDVALDPLTYVTLGASRYAGASGRTALAGKVLEVTGDEALAASVARFGRGALTAEQIASMDIKGLKQAGLYFMGKKIGGGSALGAASETLGGVAEQSLARMRLAMSDSSLMSFARSAFTPNVHKAARLALQSGNFEQTPGRVRELLALVNSRGTERAAQGIALTESQRQLDQFLTETGLANNEALAKRVTAVMEGAAPESELEANLATRAQELKLGWFKNAEGAMKAVDQSAGFGLVDNHVPWMMTDTAAEQLRNPTSRFAGEIKKGFGTDTVEAPFTARWLWQKARKDGSVDWFGTTITKEMVESNQVNIEMLNRIAREAGFQGDVFETDIVKILNRYSYTYSMQMGHAAKYSDLVQSGAVKSFDTVYEQNMALFDPAAADAQKQVVKDAVQQSSDTHVALQGALVDLRAQLSQWDKEISATLARTEGLFSADSIAAAHDAAVNAVMGLAEPTRAALEKARVSEDRLLRLFGDGIGDVPPTAAALAAEMDAITQELDATLQSAADHAIAAMGAHDAIPQVSARMAELDAQVADIQKRLTTAISRRDRAMEMGNLIEARWEEIKRGETFVASRKSGGLTVEQAKFLNGISRALGFTPGEAIIPDAVPGKLKAFISRSKGGMRDHAWWGEVRGTSGVELSASELSRLTTADVEELIAKGGVGGAAGIQQLRMAGAWMLASDAKATGGELSHYMTEVHAELVAALREASDAEVRRRAIGDLASKGRRDAVISQVGGESLASVKAVERTHRQWQLADAIATTYGTGFYEHPATAFSGVSDAQYNRLIKKVQDAGFGKGPEELKALAEQARAKADRLLQKEYSVFSASGEHQVGSLQSFMTSHGDLRISSSDLGGLGQMRTTGERLSRQSIATADETAQRLSTAVETYQLMSDFERRWRATVFESAKFGVIPSETVRREVFNAAAQDAAARWSAQSGHLNSAFAFFQEWKAEWEQLANTREFQARIRGNDVTTKDVVQGGANAADLLHSARTSTFATKYGPALEQALKNVKARWAEQGMPDISTVVDKMTATYTDPQNLLKKLTNVSEWRRVYPQAPSADIRIMQKQLYEDVALPWYKEMYGGSAGRDKVVAALRSSASGEVNPSPWRTTATLGDVQEFFSNMVGGQVRERGRTAAATTRNRFNRIKDSAPEALLVSVRGRVATEANHADMMGRLFGLAADANVDVERFVADVLGGGPPAALAGQRTPSMYAADLRRFAAEIDPRLAKVVSTAEQRDAALVQLQAARADATRAATAERAVTKPGAKYDGIPDGMSRENAKLMRDMTKRLDAYKGSADYALAVEERRRIEDLVAIAGFDLSSPTVLVGGQRIPGLQIGGYQTGNTVSAATKEGAALMEERAALLSQNQDLSWGADALTPMERAARVKSIDRKLQQLGESANAAYSSIPSNVVLMPDGSPLAFTKEEAAALFAESAPSAQELGAKAVEVGQLRERAKRMLDQLESFTPEQAQAMPLSVKIRQDALDSLNAKIEQAVSEYRAMRPETRAIARQKFEILRPHIKEFVAGQESRKAQLAIASNVSATVRDARVTAVNAAFDVTPSGLLLTKAATTEQALSDLGLRDIIQNADKAAQVADHLYEAAARHETVRPLTERPFGAPSLAETVDATQRPLGLVKSLDPNGMTSGAPDMYAQIADARRAVSSARIDTMFGAQSFNDFAANVAAPSEAWAGAVTEPLKSTAAALDQVRPPSTNLASADPNLTNTVASAMVERQKAKATAGVVGADLAQRQGRQDSSLAASKAATARTAELDQQRKALDEVLNGTKLGRKKLSNGNTIKKELGVENVSQAWERYDNARHMVELSVDVQNFLIPELQQTHDTVQSLIARLPSSKKGKLADGEMLQRTADDAARALEALRLDPENPAAVALGNAVSAEADFATASAGAEMARAQLEHLSTPVPSFKEVKEQLRDGWRQLDEMGFPGLKASPEMYDALAKMAQLEDPYFAKLVNGLIGDYTRFFKGYATLSPGFHIRNALSNTFMMVAAGGDARELARGFKLWRAMEEHMRSGRSFESWLETVPESQRALAEVAGRTMFGAGGGQTSDLLAKMGAEGKGRLMNNAALRGSQSFGHKVEGSARFMLAYDSAVKGLDFNGAMARVKRYLFDYVDLSAADKNIKAVVPFWTWMSRNLPLQLINQWTNPRAYAIYGSVMRNIAVEGAPGDVTPSWLSEQGAVKVGNDTYLAPDLGFNRVRQQLSEFGDPTRLLSYLNPGLRVPVEVLGGRQLYNDVPFSSTPQSLAAGPLSGPLSALAGALGIGDRNAQGQVVVDPRINYLLGNMIPPLAQAERLSPATDIRKERQGNAWANYMGVPVTKVTPGMKASELKRRQREIDQLKASATRLGYTP